MFSILSALLGYMYPAYSSFKTLTKRPTDEVDLERWVMYWTVLASLLTIEHVNPLIFWIPFYSLLRFMFLLYLVLPQVQGSTYIYKIYLQPFLTEYEDEIDNILERSKSRLWQEGKRWIDILWDKILSSLGISQQDAQTAAAAGGYQVPQGSGAVPPNIAVGAAQPPTLSSPLSGPVQMLGGLWRSFGPSLIASGAAFVQSQQEYLARRSGPAVSGQTTRNQPVEGYQVEGSASGANTRTQDAQMQSNFVRRRSGEESGPTVPFPIPELHPPSSSGQQMPYVHPSTPSAESSNNSGDERDRRYDTISREEVEGREDSDRPTPRSSSWFSWSPTSKGYERVKSE